MKTKIIYVLILLLLIPFSVKAEECDYSNITITNIERKSIEGNTTEIEKPTFKDKIINFNIKMFNIGDSITYNIRIKNDTKKDYMIDQKTFKTDSKYIEYILNTNDGNNVVKAKDSKVVSLTIVYKKEVVEELYNNNYNESNKLRFIINDSIKEKELNIISTEDFKNPLTGNNIIMILLLIIVMLYLYNHNKKMNNIFLILISIIIMPTVSALCKIEVVASADIQIEKKPKLYDTIVDISKEENTCVTKYIGDVTDEVGKTVTATNVYFNKCDNRRNLIFNNFCWQVVRTTETQGTKVIYNGEAVNGKCESTRGYQRGLLGYIYYTQQQDYLNNEYLYGNSFTYDLDNKTFKLTDTISSTWNESTYDKLIGKYTCLNQSGVCSQLFNINSYFSQNEAVVTTNIIGELNYAIIGTSPYNARSDSPAMIGYMFNKVYNQNIDYNDFTDAKFGKTFSYNSNTNLYSLTNDTIIISNNSNLGNIGDYRYTCWNTEGVCSKIYYIYYNHNYPFFIEISNGLGIKDAINEMISSENVNNYDSSIKGMVDSWYRHNLYDKTSSLENNVYCNDRRIANDEDWNQHDYLNLTQEALKFNYYNDNLSLSCVNKTDQFSTNNNSAKLTYPISLLQSNELKIENMENNLKIEVPYWLLTPISYEYLFGRGTSSRNAYLNESGNIYGEPVYMSFGIRPVISLKNRNIILSGDGSEANPWIIK